MSSVWTEEIDELNDKLATALDALRLAEYDHHSECVVCRAGRPWHKHKCPIAAALGRRTGWFDPKDRTFIFERTLEILNSYEESKAGVFTVKVFREDVDTIEYIIRFTRADDLESKTAYCHFWLSLRKTPLKFHNPSPIGSVCVGTCMPDGVITSEFLFEADRRVRLELLGMREVSPGVWNYQ